MGDFSPLSISMRIFSHVDYTFTAKLAILIDDAHSPCLELVALRAQTLTVLNIGRRNDHVLLKGGQRAYGGLDFHGVRV